MQREFIFSFFIFIVSFNVCYQQQNDANDESPWLLSAVPLTRQTASQARQNTQPPQPVQPSNTYASSWDDPTTEKNVVQVPNIMYKFTAKYDYATALAMSMLFYEAQRSGPLPADQRVTWRGDSALSDGEDNNIDLTGGYYDGAAYIKYGFSQAYAITMLSWGMIRYRRTYEVSGQVKYGLGTIKWATDYFLKCHVNNDEFYGQVSDKTTQSKHWGVPEDIDYNRKSYKIDKNNPGTELAAETAAALASASIVFYHDDRAYSDLLLEHAITLYDFAAVYKRSYHDSIKVAGAAYRSSGFKDELAWAAAWIYRRNGEEQFLKEAVTHYKKGRLQNPAEMFSWDDKRAGVQMLMAEVTGGAKYKNAAMKYCNFVLPGGGAKYTPGGLLYQQEWGPLRYAANAAFLCALAADMNLNVTYYRSFSLKQMDYILGSTGRSFVVGFGVNPPKGVHHISSFCPTPPAPCPRFATGLRNSKVLYGALVGGPDHIDTFYNDITNEKQSSVTLDYNAGYQSALAAVLDIHIWGQEKADRPKNDKPGIITQYEDTRNPSDGGDPVDYDTVSSPEENKFQPFYDLALKLSLLFFDAQRSGELGPTTKERVPWRSNSGLTDGQPYDLSKGYYDGTDYVKYNFPMAFAITMMSWSHLENREAFEKAGQRGFLLGSIRWGAEYLQNCVISDVQLVGQIGDPDLEAATWDRPEYLNATTRRVSLLDKANRGSDLAAETVAALASSAIAFKQQAPDFYQKLITKAENMIAFATADPAKEYTESIPSAEAKYPSSGYGDEIAWAYLWLYKATNKSVHLNAAKSIYNSFSVNARPDTFSYDVKNAAVQLLLAEITNESDDIANFCNHIVEKGITTPKGLLYIDDYMPSKHAAGVALILLQTYQKFKTHPNAKSWLKFGIHQIDYLLGSQGQGYVVGYGSDYPQQPFHRASSCPPMPIACGMSFSNTPAPNPQVLFGALVGGPDIDDEFEDYRLNKKQSSVSLDTNAVFQSALATAYALKLNGDLDNSANIHTFNFLTITLSFMTWYHLY